MAKQPNITPLGILNYKNTTGIFARTLSTVSPVFVIVWSSDNLHFKGPFHEVKITLQSKRSESPKLCSNFQFIRAIDGWIVTYIRTLKSRKVRVVAVSYDLYNWTVKSEFEVQSQDGALTHIATPQSPYVLYNGGLFVTALRSKDLTHWGQSSRLLFTSRQHHFDSHPIRIIGSAMTKKGPCVFYDAAYKKGELQVLQVGAVIFSKDDPEKILWRSHIPLWSGLIHEKYGSELSPLGVTSDGETATAYWSSQEGALVSTTIKIPLLNKDLSVVTPKGPEYLKRHSKNPIIEPHLKNSWENEAVFNPAAVYDDGKVHLFYRAIGENGISVLGYASSKDGFSFDERLDYPVHEPSTDYGISDSFDASVHKYNPLIYTSGGGWNGYEDPRAVKIDDRIYVIYLAFGGWNAMRLSLTSISINDVDNRRWNWAAPQFISAPGEVHKNWVLFPEKINGKFAILHSIAPNILIDYVDSLEHFNGEIFIKSKAPRGGRKEHWDAKVRGVGPPPLKTKLGWLVLYHANDSLEPHKYKLGAMILDKDNPQKILYRTSHPILCPDMPYENHGKPGIIYASGAIIKDNTLFVYYGGADKVVCVATAPLDEFLKSVMKDKAVRFESKNSIII